MRLRTYLITDTSPGLSRIIFHSPLDKPLRNTQTPCQDRAKRLASWYLAAFREPFRYLYHIAIRAPSRSKRDEALLTSCKSGRLRLTDLRTESLVDRKETPEFS